MATSTHWLVLATGLLMATLEPSQQLSIGDRTAARPHKQASDLQGAGQLLQVEQPKHASQPTSKQTHAHTVDRPLESGRAVINGNHATYVEPPADFKPIIYEHETVSSHWHASRGALEALESPEAADQLQALGGLPSRPQHESPYSTGMNQIGGFQAHHLKRANQQQQQHEDGKPMMAVDEFAEQALDTPPLKAAIGRWSDWHDMSAEPDLAASDTQLAPSKQQHWEQLASTSAPYKTRYGAARREPNVAAVITAATRVHSSDGQSSAGAAAAAQLRKPAALKVRATAANLIGMRESPGVEYASNGKQFNQLGNNQQQQQQQQQPQRAFYLVSPALVHAPPSPMHFLMAHHQLQHPLELMPRSHFVLAPPPVELVYAAGQTRNLPVQRHRKPLAARNAEVRLVPEDGKQVSSAPLMSDAPRVFSLGAKAKPASASGSVVQQQQLKVANSTSKPRVLKRRRIKTLLPVGLSSWTLGGIRDLDARHWKLPADLMSKLAVNDIELAHGEQQGAALMPSGGEAAATTNLKATPLEQAGPALASGSTQRPSAQHIPR